VQQGPERYSYELLKRFVYAGPGGKELPLNTGGWATAFPWFGQNAGTSLLPWPSVYLGTCAMVGEEVVRMTTSLIICYVLDRIVSLNLLALSRRSVCTLCYGSSSCPRWVAGERECCLLVLNLVSSILPCIRRPRPRLRVLDVRGFV